MSYIPTLAVALADYDRVAQQEAAQAADIAAAHEYGEKTGCYVDYDGLRIDLDNSYAASSHGLAESVRQLLPVLARFAEVMVGAAGDAGRAFTCTEAETIANVFRACGDLDAAAAWIDGHAEGDDEGDDHHRPADDAELQARIAADPLMQLLD